MIYSWESVTFLLHVKRSSIALQIMFIYYFKTICQLADHWQSHAADAVFEFATLILQEKQLNASFQRWMYTFQYLIKDNQ